MRRPWGVRCSEVKGEEEAPGPTTEDMSRTGQPVALARSDSDCSAYDCEFSVLARRLGVRLVTMDKKLLKAFPGQAVALVVA